MSNNTGPIWCYSFNKDGSGTKLDFKESEPAPRQDGVLWIHFDYSNPSMQKWIKEHSGLVPLAQNVLLSEETRPRSLVVGEALLLTLRGVNFNAGADPDDMVSIRLWLTKDLIISARQRKIMSAEDIRTQIDQGEGPTDTGDFLVRLCGQITDRMAEVVEKVDDDISLLEDQVLSLQSYQLRSKIAEVRRQCINLRRYLAPQKEALSRLFSEKTILLSDTQRMHLREIADRTIRYIEDLDSARERAAVAQEELMSILSEQMDRRMYVLSVVAAVFLPLGFLTGLLGINIGGIPGSDDSSAFLTFIVMLVGISFAQIILFRWKKWF